jgi:hypothetical protein
MLTRRLLIVALLGVGFGLLVPAVAAANPGCDTTSDPFCQADGAAPGRPDGEGGGGGGGGQGCAFAGHPMPCTDPDYGFYIGDGCYWKRLDPPPAALAPLPGKDPTTGGWGIESCYSEPGGDNVQQRYSWLENPPGGPTPAELAQQALAKIQLRGAQIGITPDPNGSGAVGLPVWLWTAVTPGTWGPVSASASGGGITVTITAKAHRIVWTMGDGQSTTCDNPGTPYEAGFGNSMSPTCGYRYTVPSANGANPDGRYTVTATTYWRVDWSGGGQSGVLTPTSQSQTSVRIGEIAVVGQ